MSIIFLLIPSLIYFLPLASMKAAAYIVCLFSFACFCVKYDTHQDKSWGELLGEIKRHPQPILSALIVLIYITGFTDWNQENLFDSKDAIDMLLALPFMSFMLFLMYLFSSVLALLLIAVAVILYLLFILAYFKIKHKDQSSRKMDAFGRLMNMKYKFPPFTPLSLFGHFLVFHTSLNWGEAGEMSKQFTYKQHFTTTIFFSLLMAIAVCALPLWFYSFPLMYAAYKIGFWSGELEQRQTKTVKAPAKQQVQVSSKF